MISQYDPISSINGIGPKYAKLLENLNIYTILDLLNHIPNRYEDRSKIAQIKDLIPESEQSMILKIERISNFFTKRGFKLTKAKGTDETGSIEIIWFNQTFITKSIKQGDNVLLYGKVIFEKNKPTLTSPEWEVLSDNVDSKSIQKIAKILPVYPTTEGITSKWLRKKIQETIQNINISEYLPNEFVLANKLLKRDTAIKIIHSPENFEDLSKAKERLAFDELLLLHLEGFKAREDWKNKENGHQISINKIELEKYIKLSPFEITNAQDRCIKEILDDLNKPSPMNRLLQGDVGSGKTLVSEAAIFACLSSGFNALLMAPTLILAKQHYNKISPKLEKFGFKSVLLTGETKQKSEPGNSNNPQLIISTHAILHNLEKYENIGLIIIDEQHKFGVEQRSKVVEHYTKDKIVPNLLTMTATPIPRSLALTLYGDLDLSVIDEMPANRKRVTTWVLPEAKRIQAYKWIYNEIAKNKNQVFIVCPFIEESSVETFKDVKAAEVEYEKTRKIFPQNINIDLLHGKTKDKETVISKFRDRTTDILVATPVIEVGVDVPSANIMVIENPERFGLASLHQLRGRVGRGEEQGYCILFLSSEEGSGRIRHLEKIYNGAELSEIDMKIRGPGNIYGTHQHGYLFLKIADITDIEFIKKTKSMAYELFVNRDKYTKIKELIKSKRYIDDH